MKKLLLFFAAVMVAGSMWAAEFVSYSTSFESTDFSATTTYNQVVTQGPSAYQWKTLGTVTTNDKKTGAQGLQMRVYSGQTATPYAQTEFNVANITKVNFSMRSEDLSVCKSVDVKYSLDGGTSWTLAENKVPTTSWADYTVNIPAQSATMRIKFEVVYTVGSKTKKLTIDDVEFYSSGAAVSVTGVSLNSSTATINEGETTTLTATVAPANATNKSISWTSSNENVAIVEDGVVTGVGAGTATITVTTADGSYTATCSVTVNAVPVTSYTLVLKEGEGTDGDASSQYNISSVSNVFSSGDAYVASVSSTSNFYPARIGRGAKLGTKSATGAFTIDLRKPVTLGKIEVVCSGYASDEKGGFTINGANFESSTYASAGFETLTYSVEGEISSITIATRSKRGYVKSITVYPAGTYAETTVSAAGYTTYYNSQKAYTMPEGVEGYVAYVDNSNTFHFVKTYEAEDVVPADEALVLKAEEGTYTLAFTTGGTAAANNDLLGTDAQTVLTDDANSYFYALSKGKADSENAGKVGFYWMNATGAAFTNGAHKAYLKVAKSAGAPAHFTLEDEVTAVENVETAEAVKFIENGQVLIKKNGVVYNVMGQIVR